MNIWKKGENDGNIYPYCIYSRQSKYEYIFFQGMESCEGENISP